jgi:hypothetical protein
MKRVIIGILLLALVALVGCGAPVVSEEPESASPAAKGPAEELALEASDIGVGWVRIRMDVKANGNWIDQTLHSRYIKDELEFTDQVTQIIKVYPDVESTLLDSELCERRYRVSLWEEQLEDLPEEDLRMLKVQREHLEDAIERAKPDLPFWDEIYIADRSFFRKGNVIVIFKLFRMIRRYDVLMECYTPLLSFQLTPEQEQWLDEENYDDVLFALAGKARNKIPL